MGMKCRIFEIARSFLIVMNLRITEIITDDK